MALAVVSQPLWSQTPPPRPEEEDVPLAEILQSPATSGVEIGSFSVKLQRTTLQDALMSFGVGQIRHEGDAGKSVYWICYLLKGSRTQSRLWLVSDGEMGGDTHVVTGIYAAYNQSDPGNAGECPELRVNSSAVHFDHGIWLEASAEKLAVLGHAPPQSAGWWRYSYQGTQKLRDRGRLESFDVTSQFDVQLRDGKVAAVWTSEILSN